MLETIVVVAVVTVALIPAARSFYRTLTGEKRGLCCGCGSGKCKNVGRQELGMNAGKGDGLMQTRRNH